MDDGALWRSLVAGDVGRAVVGTVGATARATPAVEMEVQIVERWPRMAFDQPMLLIILDWFAAVFAGAHFIDSIKIFDFSPNFRRQKNFHDQTARGKNGKLFPVAAAVCKDSFGFDF